MRYYETRRDVIVVHYVCGGLFDEQLVVTNETDSPTATFYRGILINNTHTPLWTEIRYSAISACKT